MNIQEDKDRSLTEARRYFISGVEIEKFGVLMIRGFARDDPGGRGLGSCYTNVPVSCLHHSPDGFEWGYGGSGPADLALNILDYAIKKLGLVEQVPVHCFIGECSGEAWLLHQGFKGQFIAAVPEMGGFIPWREIVEWIGDSMGMELTEPDLAEHFVTVVYQRKYFDKYGWLHSMPRYNADLSVAAFFGDVRSWLHRRYPGVKLYTVPVRDEPPFPFHMIVNDSAASLEDTELAVALRKFLKIAIYEGSWIVEDGNE